MSDEYKEFWKQMILALFQINEVIHEKKIHLYYGAVWLLMCKHSVLSRDTEKF